MMTPVSTVAPLSLRTPSLPPVIVPGPVTRQGPVLQLTTSNPGVSGKGKATQHETTVKIDGVVRDSGAVQIGVQNADALHVLTAVGNGDGRGGERRLYNGDQRARGE
jgi:hypothetical protein